MAHAAARMLAGIALTATVTVAAIAAPRASAAQKLFAPDVARELDAAIARIVKQDNLPSVAARAGIPERGQYVLVAGVADLRTRARRRAEQPFRIASLTKTFVATAVLQLVDRGKLQKTDLLEKWFPDFPNAGKITIDDLLRMRSGIAAQSDEEIIDTIYDDPSMRAPTLAEQMADSARRRDRFKPPGREGVYTNLDYFILGGIVAKITGQDVGVFSGTVPGFNTDMYYFPKLDATLIINVNRLDRDDKPRTLPVLKAVSDTLTAQFGKP